MGRVILIIVFLHTAPFINSQTTLKGYVKNKDGLGLQSVSIVLKDTLNNYIAAYTFTDEFGSYILITKETGAFNLIFNSLGHASQIISVNIKENNENIIYNVVLKEKATTLNEVIIQAERPITIKKDTINFRTKYFVDGTEQTVEDLLKKIPGLQVDNNGAIKVGNQEIEKLMVDGDDFFEKGYKVLSKNMPAYPIEEIEVIQNFSNSRLLKNIEETNKVALNLKLNEKSKRIWFGNISTSIGNDNFYELKSNLMNFGKKNKYYFLTNLNNIGYDATGDVEHLVRPYSFGQPVTIGDGEKVNNLLDMSISRLHFKESRTNLNNAKLFSLNTIFNPSEKLKIKILGFFNKDEINFYRKSIDIVDVNDLSFTNTENYKLRNKEKTIFGKLDITYNISKIKMLEATTKYKNGRFDNSSQLVFNNEDTNEALNHKNTFFDQRITYTNKLKDNKALLLTGRFIHEKSPQDYRLNQFFYQDLFPEYSNTDNVRQQSTNQMQYAGIHAHLLNRKKNSDLFELQLGNEFRKDKLQTVFSLNEETSLLANPIGYQNTISYQVNDFYMKSKYQYKIKKINLIGKVSIHHLFNTVKNNEDSKNQTPFFINPSMGFKWEINDKNKILSSYSYNTTNAGILDVLPNYVLTSYRSFSKGTDTFNQLSASNVTFNYQLGNWSDRFFANTFLIYGKNHDFFSTNTIIEQNYTQTKKIVIKDRSFININSNLDYYFKVIASNLKLDLGYAKSNYKNIVNNSDLRKVISHNYSYGFQLRSGFNGVFNYHLGMKWTDYNIETLRRNSYTNNMSFLDLSFVFSKNFDLQIQSERYFYSTLNNNNSYYFMDIEARYKLLEGKMIFGISGNNLFNTKLFKNISVSDIGSSITEYNLLPYMVLLKMEYRF